MRRGDKRRASTLLACRKGGRQECQRCVGLTCVWGVLDGDIQRIEWRSSSSLSSSTAVAVVVAPVGAAKDLVIRIPTHQTVWNRAGLEDKGGGYVGPTCGDGDGRGGHRIGLNCVMGMWWVRLWRSERRRDRQGHVCVGQSALATRMPYGPGWGDLTSGEQTILGQVETKWDSGGCCGVTLRWCHE